MANRFNPLVSVVIPVYNGENYVREAIDSVLSQTYKNIEIIVVNDGSKDNTDTILKSYGTKIRYYKKENGGVGSALNLAIKKAKGEYISWLSHDDLYKNDKISIQIDYLGNTESNKRLIVFSNFKQIDLINNKSSIGKILNLDQFTCNNFEASLSMLFTSNLHGCTLLIPKSAFEEVDYFDEKKRTTQDYHLWFKFLKHGYKFCYIPKPLVISRVHKLQDTLVKKNIHENELIELYKWAIEYFENYFHKISPDTLLAINYKIQLLGLEQIHKQFYGNERKYKYSNLQISNTDLIGNKFNGHDLHIHLQERGIDSKQLVWQKDSNDKNTYIIGAQNIDRNILFKLNFENQKKYCINSLNNFVNYEIIYNQLFLDSDIIHFHLMHNNLIDLHLLPLMSRLKPIVWTIHDAWALGGHCIHHFDCNKWQKHCNNCPYLNAIFPLNKDNSALNYALKKDAINNSNINFVVASNWMLKKIKSSPLFKNKNISLIPFGINQDIFKPIHKEKARNELKIPKDSIVLSFRSDNSEFKGIETIKYVLNKIKSDKKIIILALGGKYDHKHSNLIIKEYGWIKDDSLLAKIYSASDLFLMPSRMEAFGMMAAEAMCCGALPIVMDGTALPDVVNAPSCGISTKQDRDSYLATVQYFINNNNKVILQTNKCIEYAKKQYDLDIYIKKIINTYDIAIKNHKPTEPDILVLKQLKQYMSIQPKLESKYISNNISPLNLDDFISLNTFYNVSKYFPLSLRIKVKSILHKKYIYV